jgi:hypothetical protein
MTHLLANHKPAGKDWPPGRLLAPSCPTLPLPDLSSGPRTIAVSQICAPRSPAQILEQRSEDETALWTICAEAAPLVQPNCIFRISEVLFSPNGLVWDYYAVQPRQRSCRGFAHMERDKQRLLFRDQL